MSAANLDTYWTGQLLHAIQIASSPYSTPEQKYEAYKLSNKAREHLPSNLPSYLQKGTPYDVAVAGYTHDLGYSSQPTPTEPPPSNVGGTNDTGQTNNDGQGNGGDHQTGSVGGTNDTGSTNDNQTQPGTSSGTDAATGTTTVFDKFNLNSAITLIVSFMFLSTIFSWLKRR